MLYFIIWYSIGFFTTIVAIQMGNKEVTVGDLFGSLGMGILGILVPIILFSIWMEEHGYWKKIIDKKIF